VAATKAALAYFQLYGPERYLPLHLALFNLHGTVDGERALQEAERLGGDRKQLTQIADAEKTTQWMTEAFRAGSALGLTATPSFLVGTDAYIGGMRLAAKREAIAKARG
jgi:protein-disulfide isomerase